MKTRPAITTYTCILAVKDGGHGVSIRRCCEHAVEAVQLPPLSSWTRPEDRGYSGDAAELERLIALGAGNVSDSFTAPPDLSKSDKRLAIDDFVDAEMRRR